MMYICEFMLYSKRGLTATKKCANCGCYNQNVRVMCADCGRTLSGAEEVDEAELSEKLEKMARHSDPFSFKPRHQAVFYASLLLFAASIALIALELAQPLFALVAIFCFAMCIFRTRFAETSWKIQRFFLQFRVSGDIEPSDWWHISREIEIFAFFIAGIALFLYGLTNAAMP